MKYKHIAIALITLSLLTVTFVAAVSADVYWGNMTGIKHGKDLTFTVDTSYAATPDGSSEIFDFGLSVDLTTVVITVTDNKGVPISINIDWTDISVNPDGTSIVIQVVKQDGFPAQASAINVQADLMGPYADSSIYASGPGWAYGWR